jgi:hypothetical protein
MFLVVCNESKSNEDVVLGDYPFQVTVLEIIEPIMYYILLSQ